MSVYIENNYHKFSPSSYNAYITEPINYISDDYTSTIHYGNNQLIPIFVKEGIKFEWEELLSTETLIVEQLLDNSFCPSILFNFSLSLISEDITQLTGDQTVIFKIYIDDVLYKTYTYNLMQQVRSVYYFFEEIQCNKTVGKISVKATCDASVKLKGGNLYNGSLSRGPIIY